MTTAAVKMTAVPPRARRGSRDPGPPPPPSPGGRRASAEPAKEKPPWRIPESDLNLEQFIARHQEAITELMKRNYPPKYTKAADKLRLPRLLRAPMGRQEEIIRGAAFSLRKNRGTVIVGEMGVGKTYIAVAACKMAGFKRALVLCPTHLTRKWKREIEETLGRNQAKAVIAASISDLKRIERECRKDDANGRIWFVIMSKEMAKGTYRWKPDYERKLPVLDGKLILGEDGNPIVNDGADPRDLHSEDGRLDPHRAIALLHRVPACRDCGSLLMEKEELEGVAGRKRAFCSKCRGPLWTAAAWNLPPVCRYCKTPKAGAGICAKCGRNPLAPGYQPAARNAGRKEGPRKIALSEYLRKKMPKFFDLAITDEVHQYKEQDSAQGINVGNLAQHYGRTLALTGTLMGGYSSNTFHLLYRFSPSLREHYPYEGLARWKREYGLSDEITVWKEEDEGFKYHGRTSKRKVGRPRKKEKPGISPAALFHIIGNTLFLRLSDVSADLPPFDEIVSEVPLDYERDPETGHSQHSAYMKLHGELKSAVARSLAQGSNRLLGIYINSLLAYADGCYKGETARDPYNGEIIGDAPALPEDRIYPKERALLKIVQEEKKAGRKTLVYVSHTDTRDLTPRLKEILEREGFKSAVMKSGTPPAEKREEWIKKRVDEGIDALICNPGLVETGMDLFAFPTIVWMQPEYNVYTMRQASRRSWRIGQKQPVRVHYLIYYQTAQRQALQLIARKTQVSLSVEGELPSGGILSLAGQDDNLITTLARNIAGQTPDEKTPDWEHTLLAGRQAETEAGQPLADDDPPGWLDDEAEPETPPLPAPPKNGTRPPAPAPEPVYGGRPRQISMFEFLS